MSDPATQYIEQRTETLARVFLTRRPDVQLIRATGEGDLDLIANVLPPGRGRKGLASFGVMAWGTAQPLPDEAAAGRHLNARWRAGRDHPDYYLPVVALLYSMDDDSGYWAWTNEPVIEETSGLPRLVRPRDLDGRRVGRRTLDELVGEVLHWYEALASIVLAEV